MVVAYDSDMQADFDDIRFISSDGTTELSYWLESKTDSSTATFWVKAPSLTNGSTTIYMYYGNASAASASSGSNTFDLFDDFSGSSLDTTKWTINGSPSLSGGLCTFNDATAESILAKNLYDPSIYRVETRASFTHGGGVCDLSFGGTTSSSTSNLLSVTREPNMPGTYGFTTYNCSWGGPTNTGLGTSYTGYHKWGIYYTGSSVKATIDNSVVATHTTNYCVSYGTVYLGIQSNSTISADWILVRKYAVTEPTNSIGAEQNNPAVAFCSANIETVNGSCGDAHGQTFGLIAPTMNLCNTGTASTVANNGTTYDWMCLGASSNSDWAKRKPITVTSSSVLTNYQVKVVVAHDSDMQADFDDIRFTSSDGTTELSYWLESKTDSSTATFWVKVPSLASGSNTIYMYYGNASAASASSGDNTFDFFDGFDGSAIDTSKWTVDNSTGFSVGSGVLTGTHTSGRIRSIQTFGTGVSLEIKEKLTTLATNGHTVGGFWASTSNGVTWLEHPSTMYYRNDASWLNTGSIAPVAGVYHRYILKTISSTQVTMDAYVYNTGVSFWSLGTINNTVSSEPIMIGERADNGNYAQTYNASWDWVFVRKYSTTEPTSSVGTESINPVNVSCSATRNNISACGPVNGVVYTSAPASELLCSGGTPSAFSTSNPWAWTCTGSSWLTNYSKRKPITVTSSSVLTNYQIKVVVAYDSDMQADFDDIRFTSSDGTTELSYWLESKTDSSTATFWVKAPSLTNGSTTIYMYYGNASAASASSGSNTFDLFDDFSGTSLNTSIWSTYNVNLSFSSGIITIASATPNTGPGYIASNVSWPVNYSARVKMKGVSINTESITGFYNSTNNAGPAFTFIGNQNLITFRTQGVNRGGVGPDKTNFHVYEIKRNGTTNSYGDYENGTNIVTGTYDAGSFNFIIAPWVYSNTMYADWVTIRKYIASEPTTSLGTEESFNPNVAYCSAEKILVIDGVCGLSNNAGFSSSPTTNLCMYGTASSVSGTGPWTWTCNGINGGTNDNCSANTITTGVCGSSHGQVFGSIAPTTNFCNSGTPSLVTDNTTTYSWSCEGGSALGTTINSAWSKRKPITITNSSSVLTNYQVKVVVAYDSDMQADFDDIRFTSSDGTTELSYWLESKTDSSTATFWVKAPSLTNGSTTIYMYYGNASAASASSGSNTFDFFDDFNGSSIDRLKWTVDNSTGFSVANGLLNGTNTTGRIRSSQTFGTGVVLEVKEKTTTLAPNGHIAGGFWISVADGVSWLEHPTNRYYRNDNTWVSSGGTAIGVYHRFIFKTISSTQVSVGSYIYDTGADYWVPGVINNAVSSESIMIGKRADNAYNNQTYDASWDWVFVRKYTATEPTTTFGSEVNFSASISSAWTKRKQIDVWNPNGTLTNYQVKINTDVFNETGLVGSWHFNENSGTTIIDSSGNGNNGIITETKVAAGKFGNARNFNGTSDYVAVQDSPSLRISNYTVEVWIKPNGVPNEEWKGIVGKPGRNFNMWLNNDGYIHHRFHNSTSTNSGIADTPVGSITWDAWNYIVITNDGTTAKTYINGIERASGSSGGSQTIDNTILYMGRNLDGSSANYFNGIIDGVRIYNRALSATEISNHYDSDARLDYEDVRFTSSDGLTELNHWKEKDGTFWVKIPSLITYGNTIYMYYGNHAATSASDFSNTFGTGLKTWLKADSLAGIANSGSVATLIDSSGNNNNAIQATSTRQPAYIQNILNGKPVLRFTAANSQTMTVSTNFPAPTTVIYVSKLNGGTNGRMLSGLSNNWLLGYHGGLRQRAYFAGWLDQAVSAAVNTSPYIYTGTIGGSGVNSTFYENGTNLVSNQGGVTGPNGLSFSGYIATSEFSDGDISEILVYDNVLSDMNRLGVERYLASKYGITYTSPYTELTVFVSPETNNQVTTSCLATKEMSKPLCGPANGINYSVAPANCLLCEGGAPSALSGSNPWTWTCTAGTTVTCSTGTQPVCGSSNGGTFADEPTTNLCNPGFASAVTNNTTTWDWNCSSISWYDSSWSNRKPITINSSQTVTDYQVKIDSDLYNETNLAGSWHFNEPSGTIVYDSSGNTISSTLTGTTIATGKFGSSRNFSSDTNTMLLSPTISLASTDYTIETWFEYPLPSTTGWNTLIRGSGGDHQVIVQRSTMELGFYSHTAPSGFHSSGFKMNTLSNGWHHLVAVGSGSTTAYYIDGEYKGLVNKKSTTDVYSIGNYQGGNQQFGNIDEVRIYKRALNATEVANHYNYKARPDYEDIRFTSSDGRTELNYWKEKDGTFWVKAPSLTNGSTTIYMYYGNASATSISNGDNVFDFFDDFDSGFINAGKWTVAGTASISNGILTTLRSGADSSVISINSFGTNYILRTRARGIHSQKTDYAERVLWFGATGYSCPIFSWNNSAGQTFYTNDGTSAEMTEMGLTAGKYNTIEIVRNGTSSVKCVINDSTVITHTTRIPVGEGKFRFQAAATDSAQVDSDWILIRKYIASEPTATINGTEINPGASSVSCSAIQSGGPSATNLQSPADINSNESCWYCTHYYEGTTFTTGKNAQLEFKFTYTDSNPAETLNSYQFSIGTSSTQSSALYTSAWIPASGGIDTVITYNGISVKNIPTSSLGQIGYNGTYYWWFKVKNATSQESDWIQGTPIATPTKHWPIVRVAADKSSATIGTDIQYCTTIPSLDATTDPCYNVCWTGTGTPIVDSDNTDWKCSICYNSSNQPTLCGSNNGNSFTWTMPTSGSYQNSTTSTTSNPIIQYNVIDTNLKPQLKITGSECAGEGEGTTSNPPLPTWKEVGT